MLAERDRVGEIDRERLFFICVIDEPIMVPGLIGASLQSLFCSCQLEIDSSRSDLLPLSLLSIIVII